MIPASVISKLYKMRLTDEQLEQVVDLIEEATMAVENRAATASRRAAAADAARSARYRARLGLGDRAWGHLRRRVLQRDGFTCSYCGAAPANHCDHVIPLARGGSNDESNLVAACRPCNASKRDRLVSEWCP